MTTRRLESWELLETPSGAVAGPAQLPSDAAWLRAACPGTAAGAWRAAGRWSTDMEFDFDRSDWWWRTSFDSDPGVTSALRFDGIATIADVWLDGAHVLHSENMFVGHEVAVPPAAHHDVVVVCRSLDSWLQGVRGRPRWKTRLVANQHLRWARTCLLGRMPTWRPHAAPVGLWRPVEYIEDRLPSLSDVRLRADLEGSRGVVGIGARLRASGDVRSASITVLGATSTLDLVEGDDRTVRIRGRVAVDEPECWWPHTHGAPTLHDVTIELDHLDGCRTTLDVGPVGFRTIRADQRDGGFSVVVNGVPVFCRGACWVPLDPVTLTSTGDALDEALEQVVAAGMNMVRITGTMVDESVEFLAACDRRGVLVWHDLMFANLDYPLGDERFAESVRTEVRQILHRLLSHPSLAVVCGGSEVEQQAAMMGIDTSRIDHELGRVMLPQLVAEARLDESAPDLIVVPNSPSGGVFPFTISTGISHYFGVGAYRRPLDDARRAGVRFATECLAFSNVPDRAAVAAMLGAGAQIGHSPEWKWGVPRDRSVGWDFEDVRDHYVREIFGVEPDEVRATDPDRYLDLGRAVVAIVIEASFTEWRRPQSSCAGALVFTLRDLCAGAGWGVLDAAGRPKSAFHALGRVNAPFAVLLTNEGLDGLAAHVFNDRPDPFVGVLRACLFDVSGRMSETAQCPVAVSAHSAVSLSVDGMFAGFRDLASAYRFGPEANDIVAVELLDGSGVQCSEAVHLPAGHRRPCEFDIGLAGSAVDVDGSIEMVVSTERFAHFVSVHLPGHQPDVDWFHVVPGGCRTVRFRADGDPQRMPIELRALNSRRVVTVPVLLTNQPNRRTSS